MCFLLPPSNASKSYHTLQEKNRLWKFPPPRQESSSDFVARAMRLRFEVSCSYDIQSWCRRVLGLCLCVRPGHLICSFPGWSRNNQIDTCIDGTVDWFVAIDQLKTKWLTELRTTFIIKYLFVPRALQAEFWAVLVIPPGRSCCTSSILCLYGSWIWK